MLRERIFDDNDPRLTSAEKPRYRHQLNNRSEISGQLLTKKDSPNIHHIQPVCEGGQKTQENLTLLSEIEHKKIHSIASELHGIQKYLLHRNPPMSNWIATRYGETLGMKVQTITELSMEEGKLSRVLNGENAYGVYRRELLLDEINNLEG